MKTTVALTKEKNPAKSNLIDSLISKNLNNSKIGCEGLCIAGGSDPSGPGF